MRLHLAIERAYGQPPGWMASLPVEDQALLIADWELPEVPRGVAAR